MMNNLHAHPKLQGIFVWHGVTRGGQGEKGIISGQRAGMRGE